MARLCDDIECFILQLLKEQQQVELQRNILATQFSCAPSQINYVLSTRFTPTHGYRVESRRGGGGFVRVIRIDASRVQYIEAVRKAIGTRIGYDEAVALLGALCKREVLTLPEARLMMSAMAEEVIGSDEQAQCMRAMLFCSMLMCAAREA